MPPIQTRRIRLRGRELELHLRRVHERRPCRPAATDRTADGLKGRYGVAAERLDRHSAALHLTGELDVAAAAALEAGLRRVERWGPTSVLVDAGDVSFFDLSSVRCLAESHARLQAAGGELLVVHAPDCLLRILEVIDDLELPVI